MSILNTGVISIYKPGAGLSSLEIIPAYTFFHLRLPVSDQVYQGGRRHKKNFSVLTLRLRLKRDFCKIGSSLWLMLVSNYQINHFLENSTACYKMISGFWADFRMKPAEVWRGSYHKGNRCGYEDFGPQVLFQSKLISEEAQSSNKRIITIGRIKRVKWE